MFTGGGNVFQNAPYMLGYTGNRAHGMLTDWSSFTLKGEVAIHDIVSDTGLVRGIGLYTHSELTIDDGTALEMNRFSAGHKLYDTETKELKHPYNPSEAKPFHILWDESDSFNASYSSSIFGRFDSVSLRCIYGRDGVNDSDWIFAVDNSECANSDGLILAQMDSTEQVEGWSHWRVDSLASAFALLIIGIGVIVYFSSFCFVHKDGTEYTALLSETP